MRTRILLFVLAAALRSQPLREGLFDLREIDLHFHSGLERPVDLDEWIGLAVADGRKVIALIDHLELYRRTPAEYEEWRSKGNYQARYPMGAAGHAAVMAAFERAAKEHHLIVFKAWEVYEGELDQGMEDSPMKMADLIGWHISPNHRGDPPDGALLLKRVAQIKEAQKRYPVPMILLHPFPMRIEHLQRKARAAGRDIASIPVSEYRFFQPGEQQKLAEALRDTSIYVEISHDQEHYMRDPAVRQALIEDIKPLAAMGVQFTVSTDAHGVAEARAPFRPEAYCDPIGVDRLNTNSIIRELLAIRAKRGTSR